ncbi:MAG: starch-binding protein [Oscillospiraceae bacterium]|nr:starch-binding protein [Oscillospiraceae bacterium]
MKTRFTRSISWILTLAMVAAFVLLPIPASAAPADAAPLSIQDGVTLHCWNWSFKSIEEKMETIAALGYTSIQTSPIQQAKQATAEHPSNDWWVYYQPSAFHIDNTGTSALGTKADFISMCEAAHAHGIKVIVDVVANHMGNSETGANGLANSIVADLKNDTDCWHDINKNTNNYGDRKEVTQYCMAGLPDLNTANPKVQGMVLDFLKECIDAGADGFRFDAAKHIETPDDGALASDFWPNVINGAKEYAQSSRGIELYCYGEVLDAPGGNVGIGSYTKYMSVTDNSWGNSVLSIVRNGGSLASNYHKQADANQLVLWAESHDTFADGSTYDISEESINKAWALVAARSDAMGLYLARPANISQYLGTASNTAWAYPEVAAVNQFHNTFAGQGEYVANESGIAYVERGNAGVVLVNTKGGSVDVSVTAHTMADGTYTDQISGNTFTVADGKISGTIGSSSGIAVVYQTESCTHTTHDLDGFCADCHALVGHSYDENSTCSCGDVKVALRTVYFVNTANWSTVNFYCWYTPTDIVSDAWPGTAMTHVEDNIYCCTIPEDAPNIIFNDGSTQTDDLLLPSVGRGVDMFTYSTGKWTTYAPATDPTDPSTEPTEPSSEVTEPSSEVTEPSSEVTEPSSEATEPSSEATEPSSEATEPSSEATEPSSEATEPSSEATEPSSEATQPSDTGSQSAKKNNSNTLLVIVFIAAVVVIVGAVFGFVLKKKTAKK